MNYVWELDTDTYGPLRSSWQLKKVWDKDPLEQHFANPLRGQWKVTLAWVTKIKDRKWDCQFVNHNGNRTFRTLKAAKAYAVAIITLDT